LLRLTEVVAKWYTNVRIAFVWWSGLRKEVAMAAVEKWGDGLAVRIPENLAEILAVGEGTQIDLEFQAGALVMRPTGRPKRRLSTRRRR
jgi:antitoxin component of MazEF toxin-antitoxin module